MPDAEAQRAPVTAAVRMYKGILGDCFLIRLSQGDRESRILIDCGVLQGVKGGKDRIREIAADIVATCGGDPARGVPGELDLLAVTHEHADHISGFAQAHELLLNGKSLRIGQLWFAWTEKEDDPQAIALRARFEKRKTAVALAAACQRGEDQALAAAPDWVDLSLSAFIGEVDTSDGLGFGAAPAADAGKAPRTGRQTLQRLKEVVKTENIRYLEPGEVVETPGAVALRTYVLGPPRKEKFLFKDLPSEGPGKETYLASLALVEETMLRFADPAAGADPQETREQAMNYSSPFSRPHRTLPASQVETGNVVNGDEEVAAAAAWLRARYYAPEGPCRYESDPAPDSHECKGDPLCGPRQDYRRIDSDWLGSAGALALKLDSDTNNTSLVLAFELPSGEVLLFAADAQVGNWESWHEQTYEADGRAVTAEDILSRTILYKVGHHGSHNATLKDRGLELMSDARLTAMVPVVESIAREQGKRGWNMPFPELKAELLTRTSGRVLRGDAAKGKDADGTTLTDDADFLGRVREDPSGLWVELEVTG